MIQVASAKDPVVTVVPFTCGRLTLPQSFFLDGAQGESNYPVMAFLLRHPSGPVVFDTGLGPRLVVPPDDPRRQLVQLETSELVDARLRAVAVDPANVGIVVNSHLHTDHAGGNALLPAATVIVQGAEWDHARSSGDSTYKSFEFETGQPVRTVDGEHDLFGDGSVVLVPTPGHTPGHQSARVRTDVGEVILAGDACSLARNLDHMWLPDHAHDLAAFRESLEWFRSRRSAGAVIGFSHDSEYWDGVPHSVPWTGA